MSQFFESLEAAGFTSDFLSEEPRRTGEKKKARCPQCSDSRRKREDKCAEVTKTYDGFIFKCHHCGWGDGIKIGDGSEQYRPENYLKAQQGTRSYNLPKKEYKRPERKEAGLYAHDFVAFFAKRGISVETLRAARVECVMQYFGELGREALAARFPIEYGTELYAYKYRCIEKKTFAVSKDSELVLWGAHSLVKAREEKRKVQAFVVEGEIDYLTLLEWGICTPNGENGNIVLSVPNGVNSLACLEKHIDNGDFENVTSFTMLTDGDEVGVKMREEFARRVGKERTKYATYPDGCKDPNDVLLKYGKAATAIQSIRITEAPIDGIARLDDCLEELYNMRENGYEAYKKIGIPSLDARFTWALSGQLTVMSAPPNSAKTDLCFNVALRLAHYHDAKICIMTPETGTPTETYDAIIKMYTGMLTSHKDPMLREAPIDVVDDATFDLAVAFVREHIFVYNCDDVDMDTDTFLEIGKKMVQKHGINMLICDPYNYLSDAFESKNPKKNSMMSQHLNSNLQLIKHFSKLNNVHVVLIPHPKTMQTFERMVDFGQLNGGAAWSNKADNVIFINRLFKDVANMSEERRQKSIHIGDDMGNALLGDYVEVIVRKVKKRYAGKVGECVLAYNRFTGAFKDKADEMSGIGDEFLTIYRSRYNTQVHN